MSNVSKKMEILKRTKNFARGNKQMNKTTTTKTTLAELNTFDRLICRIDMVEEKNSELENISIKTSKTEKQEKSIKIHKNKNNIQKLWTTRKAITYV